MLPLSKLPITIKDRKLFKTFLEVLMEFFLSLILFMVFVASGLKITSEKYVCMPTTDRNSSSCNNSNIDDINFTKCIDVKELSSAAFSEFISLSCRPEKHRSLTIFEILGFCFPLVIHLISMLFNNWPWICCRLAKLQEVIENSNSDKMKETIEKINEYKKQCTVGKYYPISEESYKTDAIALQMLVMSANEIRKTFEYSNKSVQTSNSKQISKNQESQWLLIFYFVCLAFQFVWAVGYLIYLSIYISATKRDNGVKCNLTEITGYENYYFLCRHSLPELYYNISIIVCTLVVLYIICTLVHCILLRVIYNKWLPEFEKQEVLIGDFKFVLSLAYFYRYIYFSRFFEVLSKSFQSKLHLYLTECKYSVDKLKGNLEKCNNGLKFENIRSISKCLFLDTTFALVTSLEIVNSDMSDFDQEDWHCLQSLKQISELTLVKCNLQNLHNLQKSIKEMKYLRILDLSYNHLRNMGNYPFPETLERLILVKCNLDKVPTKCVNNLGLLRIFDVSCNQIAALNVMHLPDHIMIVNLLGNMTPKVVMESNNNRSGPIIFYLEKEHVKNNYSGVYFLDKVISIRKSKPNNWDKIRALSLKGKVYPVYNERKRGHIIILTEKKFDQRIEERNPQTTNTCRDSEVDDIVALKAVFCEMLYDVKIFGEGTKKESVMVYAGVECNGTVFVIFMNDNGNGTISLGGKESISIKDMVDKFAELEHRENTPKIIIKVWNYISNIAKHHHDVSSQNQHILYANVNKVNFREDFIECLQRNYEIDFATTISKWKDSNVTKRPTKEFYLLVGYPWGDTSLTWDKEARFSVSPSYQFELIIVFII